MTVQYDGGRSVDRHSHEPAKRQPERLQEANRRPRLKAKPQDRIIANAHTTGYPFCMSITIRHATLSDVAALQRLALALAAYEGEKTYCNAATWSQLLAGQAGVRLVVPVAESAGQVIGFALAYPGYDLASATPGLHLADLVVDAAHRRKGVARQLLRALAENALANDRHWVSLTALRDNANARQFYHAMGFTGPEVTFLAAGKTTMAEW